MNIEFVLSQYIEDRLYDDFRMTDAIVLSVAKDKEDETCLFALVHCKDSEKYTIVWQDDEGDQSHEGCILTDKEMATKEFEKLIEHERKGALV